MNDESFWGLERGFWLKGAEHFRSRTAEGCLMTFPEPVGVLQGVAITDSLANAPRWASVDMTDRRLSRFGDCVVVLVYRASGHRQGADAYEAFCSSTYVRVGDAWLLAQHQHTPL